MAPSRTLLLVVVPGMAALSAACGTPTSSSDGSPMASMAAGGGAESAGGSTSDRGAASGLVGGGGVGGVGGYVSAGGHGGVVQIGAGGSTGGGGSSSGSGGSATAASAIHYVFVIAMENHDGKSIYGNTKSAPYINGSLIPSYASASNFVDTLPLSIVSEPHYLWMEAGTNVFPDHTFTDDSEPSRTNSTSSTAHLSTQIDAAPGGLTWRAYQEGLDASTGACPISGSGLYAPKHDPFVFFQDVSGNPPSETNARCAEHHRPLGALAGDLASGAVASYDFITPDLCNDMHGASGCPGADDVRRGDDWLAANVPPILEFCAAQGGVLLVVWDEGESTLELPFVAAGPGVKAGYVSPVKLTHASLVRSVEEIFGLPILPTVSGDADLSDLFEPGAFP